MIKVVSAQDKASTVSFVDRLAGSEAFQSMFREGMTLVEEAAGYLDGQGRADSRALPRLEALAYASESMRLTTRLMQLASWLLLQRAVNEGEMTPQQATSEKRKVRLTNQEIASSQEMFHRLPGKLRDLVSQSLRLQARVLHMDQLIYGGAEDAVAPAEGNPVAAQMDQLRAAFSQA